MINKRLNVIIILAILLVSKANCGELFPDSTNLRSHVGFLSGLNPARNIDNLKSLDKSAQYIEDQFKFYSTRIEKQEYKVSVGKVRNIIASFGPENGPRIVVGAHYDVAGDQPGADDNASGVAGLIELAKMLAASSDSLNKRIDLVAFTLEEPPFFGTDKMGSFVHAKSINKQKLDIELMISLEMIGYYSDDSGSQAYPEEYGETLGRGPGNFISVVSNLETQVVAEKFVKNMKDKCHIPIKLFAAPASIPGVDYSDHRNYWHFGYNAIMITDTSFLRNKNYHQKTDSPETLDYSKMSNVIEGVYYAITH